jgi:TRAP-type C4-dicarboxylate transport system substrate-binding protein
MERRTIRATGATVGIALALVLSACGSSGSSSGSSGDSYTLRISAGITPGSSKYNDMILGAISTGLQDATGGKVKVKLYPSNELYKTQALALSAAAAGKVDGVLANGSDLAGLVPAWNATQLPFVAPTVAQEQKIFSPGSAWFTEAQKESEKHRLYMAALPWTNPGPVGFAFKSSGTPNITQVSGKKVRVAGAGLQADVVAGLGGQAVQLTTTEEASALSSGTVDLVGSVSPDITGTTLKGIAHSYLSPGTMNVSDYDLFFNSETWNKLPADYRTKIESALTATISKYDAGLDAQLQAALDNLKSQGVATATFSDSDIAKYSAMLEQKVWPKFQSEDSEAYAALQQSRKDAGLP